MKKTVRTYSKRMLAVFMAALMLLTAWVFVAPEKAKAVTAESYDVRAWVKVTDSMDNACMTVSLKGKANNGQGSESTLGSFTWSDKDVDEDYEQTIYEGTTSAGVFPYRINIYLGGTKYYVDRTLKLEVHLSINGTERYLTATRVSYEAETLTVTSGNPATFYWKTADILWGKNNAFNCNFDAALPQAERVEIDTPPEDVEIPPDENGTVYTEMQTHLVDQYGVRVASNQYTLNSSKYAFKVGNTAKSGVSFNSVSSSNAEYDVTSIKVTNGAKFNDPNSSTQAVTVTVDYTFNGVTRTGTTVLNLINPQYIATFNGEFPDGEGSVDPEEKELYYSYKLGTLPTVDRYGYELIDWYSEEKAASYAANKPTTSTSPYNSNRITANTQLMKDTEYHAAWWARNVKLTFLDNAEQATLYESYNSNNQTYKKYQKYDKGVDSLYSSDVGALAAANAAAAGQYVMDEYAQTQQHQPQNYVISDWVVVSAKQYIENGAQVDYPDNVGKRIGQVVLKGDTTFKAIYRYQGGNEKYTVNFYDGNTTITRSNLSYGDQIQQPEYAPTKAPDNTYTYTFLGWTEQRKSGDTVYTQDDDDSIFPLMSDSNFVVRKDLNLVAVYAQTYIDYPVTFSYNNPLGESTTQTINFHWNQSISAPEIPDYLSVGMIYKLDHWAFTDNSTADFASGTVKYLGSAYNVFHAVYDAGTPTQYTVRFLEDNGVRVGDVLTLNHGTALANYAAAARALLKDNTDEGYYRDGEAQYVFDHWEDQYGNPIGETATNSLDYKAVYDVEPLYTVTYHVDGAVAKTYQDIAGEAVEPFGEDPSKEEDLYANDYHFDGWSTTEDDPTAIVDVAGMTIADEDIDLYAIFSCTPIEYSITFDYYNGSTHVVDAQTYHYGDEIAVPTQTDRAADATYSYTFLSWDKTVSKYCMGSTEPIVYTAVYTRTFIPYEVHWLEDNHTEFKNETYFHDERIRTPYTIPACSVAADAGYTWVLTGWKYFDPVTNTTGAFVKGTDTVTQELWLIPIYEQKAGVVTVTIFYEENGVETSTAIPVAYGTTLAAFTELHTAPAKGADETKHYTFVGWVAKEEGATTPEAFTYDIALKATYEEEAHSLAITTVTKYPTHFETGLGIQTCTVCRWENQTQQTLEMLPDTTNPTSKLYVKGASWTAAEPADLTADPIPVAATSVVILNADDKAETATYNADGKGSGVATIGFYLANADALPEDLTAISTWQNEFEYDRVAISNLTDYNSVEANTTNTLSDLMGATPFADGTVFVVYAKITDRLGNVSYINSTKLVFDANAPEITIASENGNKGAKYCLDATITVTGADLVTLNGNEITLAADGTYTVTTANQYQVIATDVAGNKTTATFEVVGGHDSKTFTKAATCTVPGYSVSKCQLCGAETSPQTPIDALGHSYKSSTIQPTCVVNGYVKKVCSRCGDTIVEGIDLHPELEATGEHTWGAAYQAKAPNCTNNGVVTYTCTVCRTVDRVSGNDLDVVYLARERTAELQAEYRAAYEAAPEESQYASLEDALAAAKAAAEEEYQAAADAAIAAADEAHPARGDEKKASELVLHDNATHSYYPTQVTTQPTCTEPGEKTKTCMYCGNRLHIADISATGHSFGEWAVVTEPTCQTEGLKRRECSACDAYEEEAIGTVEHNWIPVETVAPYKDPETGEPHDGFVRYECSYNCGTPHDNDILPYVEPVSYTFTFKNGDETVATLTKAPGETIEEGEVETPTKAATPQYKYTFKAWVNSENQEVSFPITVMAETGSQTYTATFTQEKQYYTLTFLKDDGTQYMQVGPKAFDDEVTVAGPAKNSDTNNTYTFAGWKLAAETEGVWAPVEGAEAQTTITVSGAQTFIATYTATARTYTVRWRVGTSIVKTVTDVAPGTLLSELTAPTDPESTYTDTQHNLFKNWDLPGSTPINSDTYVNAVLETKAHSFELQSTTPATCVKPKTEIYKCPVCGYEKEMKSGGTLDHDFEHGTVVAYTPVTVDADGYRKTKCANCDATKEEVLKRVLLKVTVKDTNGNPVSGETVKVFETDANGGGFVNSGVTNSSGVAQIYVTKAGKYKIVVGSKSSEVTVDANGNITSGSVPSPDASGGHTTPVSSGCDCTCHKSGFWPMIFRFFHKLIKLLTGEFRCCPDANY